jgi:hypothetical protein
MSRVPSCSGSSPALSGKLPQSTVQSNRSNFQEDTVFPNTLQPQLNVKTRKIGESAQRSSLPTLQIPVSTHRPLVKQPSEPRRELSNAPQSKHDQQHQAQRKSARINNETKARLLTPDKARLEQIVHDIILSEGSSPRQAAQTIVSKLLEQISKPASAPPRRPTPDASSTTKPLVCPECSSQVSRVCDLNKHMKRHKKPYGCTYPQCNKHFGAKSDWKRHENSQHFQLEAYRCTQILTDTRKVCGKHYYRADAFKDHLTAEHEVLSEEMTLVVKRSKIGKNCQVQHWCGFCQVIRPLKEKRNEAWDERFDHIAYHFEKEKKSIDEWLCVEANKTKKEVLEEMHRDAFGDEEEAPHEDGAKCETPDANVDAAGDSDDSPTYQPPIPVISPVHNSRRKRKRTLTSPLPAESEAHERSYTWECVCIATSSFDLSRTANRS